jgi:hypothetical protein
MNQDLQRQIRQLRIINAASVVLLAAVVTSGFGSIQASRSPGDTLDVKRINILNENGLPALVIAGQGMLPGPTFEGKQYPQELSGGRARAAGMIFFNERGDEVGGLTFSGDLTQNGYAASGHFSFDQFHQDQVVAMQYGDNGSTRRSGISVWDRSTEISIAEVLEILNARLSAAGPARDSLNAAIRALADRGLGTHRVFLGSQNRTAVLQLLDTGGRPRIRLSVDSLDVPRLEFLDEAGTVVLRLPS